MERNDLSMARRRVSLVLYCLIRRRRQEDGGVEFLMIEKGSRGMTFPPTKFQPGEELYTTLTRPMEEDLGLPARSYYPEEELPVIPNEEAGPQYEGLTKRWYLYPVDVSLEEQALAEWASAGTETAWWTIDEILDRVEEPNVRAIAEYIREQRPKLLTEVVSRPSMQAQASEWAGRNREGVRVVRDAELRAILAEGSRAFNLRVADPYLPYQTQGLGFTWSFFTPKDKQNVHVHGLPAVEIYGVLEGRLQVWHKPMNRRGVTAWRCDTLEAGDWVEVEPLHCHFACWAEPEGIGTVIKAAATGELAGIGKLGICGKTTCEYCSVQTQCALEPRMTELLEQYALEFPQRDYGRIAVLVAEGTDP